MKAAVPVPVTVKCRIGVDDQDPEAALDELARRVVEAGVNGLIVHARKAWLKGLSPRENREIPPLDYERVYRLRRAWPALPLLVNGGITTFAQIETHLAHTDGVMLGRAAYQNPELLLQVDPVLYGEAAPVAGPIEAIERLLPYIEAQRAGGVRLHQITRHLLGLFPGRPGARAFRRHLATRATAPGAGPEVLMEAVALVAREGNLAQAAA
jgi:tRNA-dihydrouridine synthase A